RDRLGKGKQLGRKRRTAGLDGRGSTHARGAEGATQGRRKGVRLTARMEGRAAHGSDGRAWLTSQAQGTRGSQAAEGRAVYGSIEMSSAYALGSRFGRKWRAAHGSGGSGAQLTARNLKGIG
ncbi:hypothetical protein Csa_023766, partial [Cucumis sativus]